MIKTIYAVFASVIVIKTVRQIKCIKLIAGTFWITFMRNSSHTLIDYLIIAGGGLDKGRSAIAQNRTCFRTPLVLPLPVCLLIPMVSVVRPIPVQFPECHGHLASTDFVIIINFLTIPVRIIVELQAVIHRIIRIVIPLSQTQRNVNRPAVYPQLRRYGTTLSKGFYTGACTIIVLQTIFTQLILNASGNHNIFARFGRTTGSILIFTRIAAAIAIAIPPMMSFFNS